MRRSWARNSLLLHYPKSFRRLVVTIKTHGNDLDNDVVFDPNIELHGVPIAGLAGTASSFDKNSALTR
ncbi:MAG: hypothetical protein AB7O52_19645 [Planctomycetota bacterium]